MGDIYLYNNEMWKVKHKFLYSGQKEEFTLDPGRYLCICKGAKGGPGYTGFENKGGCSYGILNLTSALTAYAVVGGDGVKSEYTSKVLEGNSKYKGWLVINGRSENGFKEMRIIKDLAGLDRVVYARKE